MICGIFDTPSSPLCANSHNPHCGLLWLITLPAFDHTPVNADVVDAPNETRPKLSHLYDGLNVADPLIETLGAVADFLSRHLEAL